MSECITQNLLTEKQAADVAGVSQKTIRRLIDDGRLAAVNYGTRDRKCYRIQPDQLLQVAPLQSENDNITLPAPRRLLHRPAAALRVAAYLPRVSA